MKYKDLIQFDPIDEIIKFSKLENEDYRAKIVGNFVCSKTYEEYIIPQICATLDLSSTKETKGIQIVGNYGTGKSHLMSLFTIIAEDASYLSLLKSEKAKERLKSIAGKYKVFRFELGNNQELWDIVTYKIDNALQQWGVDYRISDDDRRGASYSEKLEQMMAAFEEVYPDKGFMLVIDEMLSYLKGRSTPDKLNRDLAVLQALGQMSDRTHFRMVFGVQELIYQSAEFQFAKDMLSHVNERYVDLTIQKEDVQFIVQQRLLQKNEHQKEAIRQHLSKFAVMFPHMSNNLDSYVSLYPVHPDYFDNFALIRIGKSQREVLKTLSNKFQRIMDDDVPTDEPGLICYDSYWQDMLSNVDLKADPDVRRVSEVTALVDQKINENFTKGLAPKKTLAHRIVAASAIKMLQAELSRANGVTADALATDLCPIDPTVESYDELVDLVITRVLNSIVSATVGQYFEKGDNNQYHLRIEGGVNYEQKIRDYATQMSDSQKDEYFFQFLAEVLPVEGETYRRNFRIWKHHIEWLTHHCWRSGYIFMGHPNERSTTQPQQHFYIYFMPIFSPQTDERPVLGDSVYFLMNGLTEDFRNQIALYGAASALMGIASSDEKPRYKQILDKIFKKSRDLFNEQFLRNTVVEYLGKQNPLQSMQGADADSKIDTVSQVTSYLMEAQFEGENPHYPKFTALQQPLTPENRDNYLRSARAKIADPTKLNRNGEAILMGLGLWENGQLSSKGSPYAQSLKQQLEAKNGQVLNRDEILELFFADTHEYITRDFHIEAELEILVIGTMVALGEIELVLNGGNRINASKIADFANLQPQDAYTFANICPPKGVNIPLVRELMMGLLGVDRTGDMDRPNTDVFAQLSAKAQDVEAQVAKLQHSILNGYRIAGTIEVISREEALNLDNELVRLKGICNRVPRYNTKAKMANFDLPVDVVRTTMTDTMAKLHDMQALLSEMRKFGAIASYLNTALSNVPDGTPLRDEIEAAISSFQELVSMTAAERKTFQNDLEQVRKDYIDFYMQSYLSAHVSEIEFQRVERLNLDERKQVCEDVHDATFINPSRFDEWKKRLAQLKIVDSRVSREYLTETPVAPDGFNPINAKRDLPKIDELTDELAEIYNDYESQFRETLEDPMIRKNLDVLTAEERSLFQQFADGDIELKRPYVRPLVGIIQKLQKSFTRIEISHNDMLRIFSRPMTKDQAIAAFTEYINEKSRGHRIEDVRIIIK